MPTDSQRLAVIEAVVMRLEKNLFGDDGQGGKLASLEAATDRKWGSLDRRVTKLENWRWYVVGIAMGVGAALGIGLQKLVAAVVK